MDILNSTTTDTNISTFGYTNIYNIGNDNATDDAVTSSDVIPDDVFKRYSGMRFLEIFAPFAVMVDRTVTPIWYIIGLLGNAISATVWLQKRMRLNNSSALYLAALAIADLSFLMLHILQELKYAWGYDTLSYPGLCEIYFIVYLMTQSLSPMIVLGFSLERWVAVCHPFYKTNYCTHKRATTILLLLVTVSLCLCVLQGYFWTYDTDTGQCIVRESVLVGGERSLWSIYSWITEIIMFLIVPLVILVLNAMVIHEVRSISRSGHERYLGSQVSSATGVIGASVTTTIMLLSVSFFAIATTVPATFIYVIATCVPYGNTRMSDVEITKDSTWQNYFLYITVRKIVDEICLSHYAINVFQYLITGQHFRRCVRELFKRGVETVAIRRKYSGVSMEQTFHRTHTSRV